MKKIINLVPPNYRKSEEQKAAELASLLKMLADRIEQDRHKQS